jgi:hypothetical protein
MVRVKYVALVIVLLVGNGSVYAQKTKPEIKVVKCIDKEVIDDIVEALSTVENESEIKAKIEAAMLKKGKTYCKETDASKESTKTKL